MTIPKPLLRTLESVRNTRLFIPNYGQYRGSDVAEAFDSLSQYTQTQLQVVSDSIPAASSSAAPPSSSSSSDNEAWIGLPVRTLLASSVSIGQNTLTSAITAAVTFPAYGTSWAADIRYALFVVVGANVVGCEIHDGQSNVYGVTQRNSNGSGYECLVASDFSAGIYAPGSQVIFTLYVTCNASGMTAYPSEQISMGLTGKSFLCITPTRIS